MNEIEKLRLFSLGDWYQISKDEDQFLLVGSGVAEDMTEDLDIATLAARCRLVLSEL